MPELAGASVSNAEAEVMASRMRRRAQALEVLSRTDSIWSTWSYVAAIALGAALGAWMQREANNVVGTFGFIGFVLASSLYSEVRELKRKLSALVQVALEDGAP